MFVCVSVCMCMCVSVCICMCVCMCLYVCVSRRRAVFENRPSQQHESNVDRSVYIVAKGLSFSLNTIALYLSFYKIRKLRKIHYEDEIQKRPAERSSIKADVDVDVDVI